MATQPNLEKKANLAKAAIIDKVINDCKKEMENADGPVTCYLPKECHEMIGCDVEFIKSIFSLKHPEWNDVILEDGNHVSEYIPEYLHYSSGYDIFGNKHIDMVYVENDKKRKYISVPHTDLATTPSGPQNNREVPFLYECLVEKPI